MVCLLCGLQSVELRHSAALSKSEALEVLLVFLLLIDTDDSSRSS